MLEGKRIFITGGAGFIGSTLARQLADRNQVVAYDNLHRDALSGTDLAEHPNLTFVQGDILDPEALIDASAGATHFVHAAAIAGVDTVLASPVRTMRVNVIGTYNALERNKLLVQQYVFRQSFQKSTDMIEQLLTRTELFF